MADVINMKAVKTFYGTDGYIVAGQEFFTTSQNLANSYYHDGLAVFADGSEPKVKEEDLKVQARNRYVEEEKQTEFKTSQLERNVTSLANPVNLKISVSGVNPEDLNVEVVRDEEPRVETVAVEETRQAQSQNPSEKQQLQPNYQTQNQGSSQQQNVHPSQNQQVNQYAQTRPSPQEVARINEDPNNRDLGEAGTFTQQQQAGYDSNPPETQSGPPAETPAPFQSQSQEDFRQREQELIQQLNELRQQQRQAASQNPQSQTNPSGQSQEQNGQAESQNSGGAAQSQSEGFTVRHVGGGWYDLPNGERVQGKENAEARLKEIEQAYEQQQQAQVQSQNSGGSQEGNGFTPNQDRVRQANVAPQDGASLNQAQVETYGNLSGGQPSGRLTGSAQNNNVGRAQGNGVGEGNSSNPRVNANLQPRNSDGQFVESSGVAGGSTGATGSGAGGNTSGATGAGSTGGNTNGSTGGNTGGSSGGGNTGGSTGGGNTGQ